MTINRFILNPVNQRSRRPAFTGALLSSQLRVFIVWRPLQVGAKYGIGIVPANAEKIAVDPIEQVANDTYANRYEVADEDVISINFAPI